MLKNKKNRILYAGNIGENSFINSNSSPQKWKVYEDTHEGREKALADGNNSFSAFSFSHPVEQGKQQPMRFGDMVLDFDAKKDVWDDYTGESKRVGDIPTALKAVRNFIAVLCYNYDVNPECLRYYASGGKGFHVMVPAKLIGSENGDIALNDIYQSILDHILSFDPDNSSIPEALKVRYTNLALEEKYIDNCGFKGGKGQLIRLPHIRRYDGNFKVPVTYDEITQCDASFFEDIVKQDRNIFEEDNWSEFEKTIEVAPKLQKILLEAKKTNLCFNSKVQKMAVTGTAFKCDFIKDCYDNAKSLVEPAWFLLARICVAMGSLGCNFFHLISANDPDRYDEDETQKKLEHAHQYGIPTCKEIQKAGFCQKNCQIKCPIDHYQQIYTANNDTGEYAATPSGLLYYPDASDKTSYVKVSSYIEVIARGRTAEGQCWSKYVKLIDSDGNEHLLSIPATDLSGTAENALNSLLNAGLEFDHEKANRYRLLRYLRNTFPDKRALVIQKSGWFEIKPHNKNHRKVLLFAPHDLGEHKSGDYLIFDPRISKPLVEIKGTLEEWQENIGKMCEGNPLLQLVIMLGVAPLFLQMMGHSGFGIHLYGGSSSGKSTGLKINSSVTGVNFTTWRKTDNALEGQAVLHNHLCMILDELGQGTADAVDAAIYMLANGEGKGRASKYGQARDIFTWCCLFLSSGELTSAEKIRQGFNKRPMAGQAVRLVCLLADGGSGNKIFTKIPQGLTAAEFADTLSVNSTKYKGTPLLAYIRSIQSKHGTNEVENFIHKEKVAFFTSINNVVLNSQSRRVADNFALLAAVGEYGIKQGFFSWENGACQYAAKYCFELWLRLHGGPVELEIQELGKKIIELVENNFNGKFSSFYTPDKKADPVYYYEENKKRCCFIARKYLTENSFCRDDQYQELVKHLDSKKLLVRRNDRVQTQKSFSGKRPPRGFSVIIDNIYAELYETDENKKNTNHTTPNKPPEMISF